MIFGIHNVSSSQIIKFDYDTSYVLRLIDSSSQFIGNDFTLAIKFASRAKDISKNIGYKVGVIKSINREGGAYQSINNLPKALSSYTEVIKLSEEIGYKKGIGAASTNIGFVYNLKDDYKTALFYHKNALKIFEELQDTINIIQTFNQITAAYLENNIDSALIYGQMAYQLALKNNDEKKLAISCFYLGQIHEKLNSLDMALSYEKLAAEKFIRSNVMNDLSSTYNQIGIIYKKIRMMDSATYYFRLSYEVSKKLNFHYNIVNSSKELIKIFEDGKNKDSILKYLRIYSNSNDTLTNEIKQKKLQTLLINENLRIIEIQDKKDLDSLNQQNNIKLFGIFIFIVLFSIIVLSIRKRKTFQKTITFLGVLALMMTFELINIIIHPLLDKITNHNVLLIFIALLITAIFLIPLHHKLENFVKTRLTKRTLFKKKKPSN